MPEFSCHNMGIVLAFAIDLRVQQKKREEKFALLSIFCPVSQQGVSTVGKQYHGCTIPYEKNWN